MRWLAIWTAAFVVSLSLGGVQAGQTSGDIDQVAGVNKDCVAEVFGYVAEGKAPVRGQARFDHFKKRFVTEPDLLGQRNPKFVAIGGKRGGNSDVSALPQCGNAAGLY